MPSADMELSSFVWVIFYICTLLMGVQNGTATLKTNFVSCKDLHILLCDTIILLLFTQEKWKHMSKQKLV